MASLRSLATAGALSLLSLARPVLSQAPPAPEGVTTIQSKLHPGISISYKEVRRSFTAFSSASFHIALQWRRSLSRFTIANLAFDTTAWPSARLRPTSNHMPDTSTYQRVRRMILEVDKIIQLIPSFGSLSRGKIPPMRHCQYVGTRKQFTSFEPH